MERQSLAADGITRHGCEPGELQEVRREPHVPGPMGIAETATVRSWASQAEEAS